MCGIAGIIGLTDHTVTESKVRTMLSALSRRGPDDEGVEIWDRAVLGHRRLAIFDLSKAGHQPMISTSGSIGVVFNGAIYNHLELRTQLIAAGYNFRSKTDTEVLVHGYEEWGLHDLVAKLRGMFAFALWDNRIQKLFLVRDRLGVKPLVFVACKNVIMFASTVRALRAAGCANELDDGAIAEFLSCGFVTDTRSIFKEITKVPQASIVEWSNGILTQYPYWQPPVAQEIARQSFSQIVDETEELFLDSVKLRVQADVPVGALLSGGIDSGLICWALTRLGVDVTAYTVGTPRDPWDESAEARATARALGITHRLVEISDNDAPNVDELVSAYAEPFACASALGMLTISRAVAPHVKVLLTGDGGDDVFLGYPQHRHLWLAEKLSRNTLFNVTNFWRWSRPAFPRIGILRRAAAFLDYASGDLSAFTINSDGLSQCKGKGLLGERLLKFPTHASQSAWSVDTKSLLANLIDYERKTQFVGEYMTKVDGATMYYGVEARSPFLDHTLWEYAGSIPFDLRLHRGRLKSILRELAGRRIQNKIARRRKRGFGIPVQRWLVGRWRKWVEDVFHDSLLNREGWICSRAVLQDLASAAKRGWADNYVWNIFVLESWLKHELQPISIRL